MPALAPLRHPRDHTLAPTTHHITSSAIWLFAICYLRSAICDLPPHHLDLHPRHTLIRRRSQLLLTATAQPHRHLIHRRRVLRRHRQHTTRHTTRPATLPQLPRHNPLPRLIQTPQCRLRTLQTHHLRRDRLAHLTPRLRPRTQPPQILQRPHRRIQRNRTRHRIKHSLRASRRPTRLIRHGPASVSERTRSRNRRRPPTRPTRPLLCNLLRHHLAPYGLHTPPAPHAASDRLFFASRP